MAIELAPIAAALGVAGAAIKLSSDIAGAFCKDDTKTINKLIVSVSVIGSCAHDIKDILRRLQKAKTKETKDELLSIASKKTEEMLLAVRDVIRILARIWSKPSLALRILMWVRRK